MNRFEIHFTKLKTDNDKLFLLLPTIGIARYKGKYFNSISIHIAWLYWNLEICYNVI